MLENKWLTWGTRVRREKEIKGERYVHKCNTLFNILVGRNIEETRALPRR